MIKRSIEKIARLLFTKYPVVSITGPRQSGKTTLIKHIFSHLPYVSLEDPDETQFAINDPRGFLSRFQKGALLDEIQRTPQLFSYIQTEVDNRGKNGQFVLSGSQNFLLIESISQSLAGRVAVLKLLPLSMVEIKKADLFPEKYEELIFKGFFPGIYANDISPGFFFSNYIQTYVERDIRSIRQIGDLHSFTRFMQLCAGRIGQLLNLTSLAGDCGISVNTAKAWISILESSYTIFLLQPHHQNFNKRLVKMPKLYFCDTGLASSLLRIEKADQLTTHYMTGPLFENMVIAEMLKYRYNDGKQSNLFFWRDSKGKEIDCLIEEANKLIPVEIKSGRTFNPDFLSGLNYWNGISKNSPENTFVIYGGENDYPTSNGKVLGWKKTAEILK